MNKPLVERIDALRWRITNQRELSELDSILADVRELVEAAKGFVVEADPAHHDDQLVTPQRSLSAGHYRRLSAILRKVGGDIGTAPSLPAGEPQNSASNPLSPGEYFRCDECHEPAGLRQVCRSCVRLEIERDDAGEVSCWRVAGGTWVDGEPLPCDYKDAEQNGWAIELAYTEQALPKKDSNETNVVESQNSAVCKGCGGTGEVGGFINMDSGYQTDPCPFCTPKNSAVKVPDEVSAAYEELILAVGNKYPGETRHDTARRYIQQAESQTCSACQSLTHPTETPR